MIKRSCSSKIRYQTFSDPWVNETTIFRRRLLDYLEMKRCVRPSLEKRQNWVKSLPVFRPKRRKSFTQSGSTYLSPPGVKQEIWTPRKTEIWPRWIHRFVQVSGSNHSRENVTTSYREIIGNSVCIHFLCLCCSGGPETDKDTKSRN